MKVFPKGTLKFLLLDQQAITRNAERKKAGAPVVLVAEVPATGELPTFHAGYGLFTKGPVDFAYDQQGSVVIRKREKFRAAFTTTGEVRLATEHGEDLSKAPATTTEDKK